MQLHSLDDAIAPLRRIVAIDRETRGRRLPTSVSLAKLFGCGPRSVQRDLEFLRHRLRAPLVFDRRKNGYRYGRPFDLQKSLWGYLRRISTYRTPAAPMPSESLRERLLADRGEGGAA